MTTTTPDADQVEITISRVIDAPRERVFAAYVTPEQLAQFWAPAGLTIPLSTVVIEPHAGGAFEAVMVAGSDGTEYPMKARFVEVAEPGRIVFTVPASGRLTELTFTDVEGRTKVTFHQTNVAVEAQADTESGVTSSLERLASLVTA